MGGEIWMQGEVKEVGISGCKYFREGAVTAAEERRGDGMISAKVPGSMEAPPKVHYGIARIVMTGAVTGVVLVRTYTAYIYSPVVCRVCTRQLVLDICPFSHGELEGSLVGVE